ADRFQETLGQTLDLHPYTNTLGGASISGLVPRVQPPGPLLIGHRGRVFAEQIGDRHRFSAKGPAWFPFTNRTSDAVPSGFVIPPPSDVRRDRTAAIPAVDNPA